MTPARSAEYALLRTIAGVAPTSLPCPGNEGRGRSVNILIVIASGLVGWCPLPQPKPNPDPTPKEPIAGFIGGIAGAYLVFYGLGLEGVNQATDFIAISIGASRWVWSFKR